MFRKLAAVILALLMVTGATILALTKGWGLQPVSYPWILGMQVGVPFLVRLLLDAAVDSSECERCAGKTRG